MAALTRSKDRKITNAVTKGGAPAIANSFGLPAGKQWSCPGATDFCSKICYAGKLEKVYKGVRTVLERNFEIIDTASGLAERFNLLDDMIQDFKRDCDKRGAEKLFRIHWDGDFYSAAYTAAWAKVIAHHPDVQFWAYTRVNSAAMFLHGKRLGNLSLYYSADRDNIESARHMERLGIKLAYVGDTFDEGKAVVPNAVRCPENNKAIELITPEGSACVRCGMCVKGRRSVLFSASKK